MKILIKNVLLNNEKVDIFIADGTITDISSRCLRDADRIIDGSNKIALPSFINAHTHAAMTLFRGYADDMPLKTWLEEKIWPLEAKLTEEDVYWGAKLACLEMIRNGITVFNDMYWQWEATAQAVCDTGIRAIISAVFIDMFDPVKSDEQIEENLRLFSLSEKYRPNVIFAFGPHAVYTVSRKSLEWIRDFSEKENILIHMHLAETENEMSFCRDKYGLTPVEFLDSVGLLTKRYVGCHACMLDENDCLRIKERRGNLVHVPVSNLKLAVDRIFPHLLVKKHAIPYCFGTDGCASNNHLDIMETMKFASLLAKYSTHDPTMLPAREALENATRTAAAIFNLGNWDIQVGNSPDIILIDVQRPEFVPNFDTCSDMVYAAQSSCVDTVICMGKVLMEGRHVPGQEEILKKAGEIARALVKR
ncbi:MAG TPA: amidohydrolase [Syntrophorhabdaceae bacterium]|nr:amidohydrolase [Syntrophorhabdaceae bacterium]